MKKAYNGYSCVGVKQEFSVYDIEAMNACQCFKLPGEIFSCTQCARSVLVGIKDKVIRLRYPKGSSSNVTYLKDSSEDLQCMTALLISGLAPAGVFADKLQEEFPQHEEAANILREWGEAKTNE